MVKVSEAQGGDDFKTELKKLIDLSRCRIYRGCQVACKQRNEAPFKATRNTGGYQHQADLQWNTSALIRFQEDVDPNGMLIMWFPLGYSVDLVRWMLVAQAMGLSSFALPI